MKSYKIINFLCTLLIGIFAGAMIPAQSEAMSIVAHTLGIAGAFIATPNGLITNQFSYRTANQPSPNYQATQGMPPSGSGNIVVRGTGIYDYFDQFSLFADNSAGVAPAVFKMQSADGLVETANGASLAANVFATPDLATVAGVDLGGAALTGLNCIRRYLHTVAIVVEYMNYEGSVAAQLSNSPFLFQANPKGEVWNVSRSVAIYKSNMQFNAALIPNTTPFILTANHAIRLSVNIAATAILTFKVKSILDYSKIIQS